MNSTELEEIKKRLKLDKFKRSSREGHLKKRGKDYGLKDLRRYIEDNYDIDISKQNTEELTDLFFISEPTPIDVNNSALYNLFNQSHTYYYLSYNGKTNQLANKTTFQSYKDVAKSTLKIEVQNQEGSSGEEAETRIRVKSRSAIFRYEPYNQRKFYIKAGDDILNMFVPPEHSFTRQEVETPPRTILEFLVHLFDSREEEIEYCLDWLATLLKRKNNCYLTLVGEQGVGKNTLTEIIAAGLVGDDNFGIVSNSRLKKEFTNFLEGNQLIHFSEANLDDEDVLNKLKLFQDAIIEIERKGVDVYKTDNFMNGIITSNDDHKIRILPNERRYSFLQLTAKNFVDSELFKRFSTYERFKQQITAEIPEFYWWLSNREVKRSMSKPFINPEHRDGIFNMSMSRQESTIMSYINDNSHHTDLKITHIENHLETTFGQRTMKPTKIYKFLQSVEGVDVKRKASPIGETIVEITR